jgi:carbon-monoxide dehydrogenase medium subunit
MYAPSFEYYRAGAVKEALALLKQHPGAKILAGGHSLLPVLKLRLATPPALIDIGRIPELKGITTAGGRIRIGALTTHAELAASEVLKTSCPMLSEAAGHIGDAQVRNCGTIGGNVAHADPASDLPTVLLALDAQFTVAGAQGERTIAAADFFQGWMTTALGEHELLTAIELPERQAGQGMAYAKFVHPASRYAVVGAAAIVTMKSGACSGARVVIGGPCPLPGGPERGRSAGGARRQRRSDPKAAATVAQDLGDDVIGDLFASSDYRKSVAPVFVGALSAIERAALTGCDRSVDELERLLSGASATLPIAVSSSVPQRSSSDAPLPRRGAGVGKTEIAKALACSGTDLIRLQCYEGLDISHALYEWNYPRQLLEIRLLEASHALDRVRATEQLFTEPFLIKRPLLKALQHEPGRVPVLLIDELDRADEEFEGFLLELLRTIR